MLQSLMCRKIAAENSFILEVVIIVQINPLFATIWNYGHVHFWRPEIVFATQDSQKSIFFIVSYHICK